MGHLREEYDARTYWEDDPVGTFELILTDARVILWLNGGEYGPIRMIASNEFRSKWIAREIYNAARDHIHEEDYDPTVANVVRYIFD